MKHKDPIQAFFGNDTEFSGTLTFEGAVKIDGKFEGEIKTEEGGELVVGPKAVVKAEVHVGILTVQGKMEGDVTVSKKLNISSEGQVIGNVTAPALFIEDGAVLEGSVSMITPGGEPVPPKDDVATKNELTGAREIGKKVGAEELH